MHGEPCVVRRSFFSSLVTGIATFATVVVVCATAIGLYGLNVVDRKSSIVLYPTMDAVRGLLTNWRESLPPVLADAVEDRRAPEYREKLHFEARVEDGGLDEQRVVVEVKNGGAELVSLLSTRLVARDEEGRVVLTKPLFAATPVTLPDNDWPGPILPGDVRVLMRPFWTDTEIAKVDVEVTEVRVWAEDSGNSKADLPATASSRN